MLRFRKLADELRGGSKTKKGRIAAALCLFLAPRDGLEPPTR